MSRRFDWLNNPYLWMVAVVIGLVGVANWPASPRVVDDATVWEEPASPSGDELTEYLSNEGWMEPPLPGEASHLRRLSDRKNPRSVLSIPPRHQPSGS